MRRAARSSDNRYATTEGQTVAAGTLAAERISPNVKRARVIIRSSQLVVNVPIVGAARKLDDAPIF